jgi:hypothetical protein
VRTHNSKYWYTTIVRSWQVYRVTPAVGERAPGSESGESTLRLACVMLTTLLAIQACMHWLDLARFALPGQRHVVRAVCCAITVWFKLD